MTRHLVFSTLCLMLSACDSAAPAVPDASAPPPADGGETPDAERPSSSVCQAYMARVTECVPGYDDECRADALAESCERMVAGGFITPLSFCLGRDTCESGLLRDSCIRSTVESTPPASELDSVVTTLCAACPENASALQASTAEECEAFVDEALDGGTGATHDIVRARLLLLTEAQLYALRDCVAANPSCAAWDAERCGQLYDDLDAVLTPDWSGPTCE